MTNAAEKLAKRHFGPGTKLNVHRMAGGISSEIYKVEGFNAEGQTVDPVVLTILRDPDEWWKLEKEGLVRDLIAHDPEVLLPELIDLGFDKVGGKQVAFLISEFISGGDLDAFIERELPQDADRTKLSGLAYDIGSRIAALHRHNAGIYGLVGFAPEQHASWQQYVLSEFQREDNLITQLNPSLQIESVSAYELQQSLGAIQVLVGQFQSTLITPEQQLSHGDARFGNLMANSNDQGDWRVTSMIDLEAMLGGDPEIDITFMENWLHFSSYKKDFFAQKDQYKNGYRNFRTPSTNYDRKRIIYHAIRSLAYLRTVFGFNIVEFVSADSRHVGYVEKHMQIVRSLARGNYLEDLGIKALI